MLLILEPRQPGSQAFHRATQIQPANPKGNQPWIFIGRTDAEAETPILWPPGVKNWLFAKDPEAGKDCRQEEKRATEDEMVGWHHWLDGHEFEHTPGFGKGQGNLECCSPWGHKESDTTERLNWMGLTQQIEMGYRTIFICPLPLFWKGIFLGL